MVRNVPHLKLELINLFSLFNKKRVEYVLLRNYSYFQENNGIEPRDIDILVNTKSRNKALNILAEEGYVNTNTILVPGQSNYIKFIDKANRFLSIDVNMGGLSHKGIVYLQQKYLFDKVIKMNGIKYLNTNDFLISLLLHSIIDKKYFKSEYKNLIRSLIINNSYSKDVFLKKLEIITNKCIAKEITKALKKKDYQSLVNLKSRLILTTIYKQPINIYNFLVIHFFKVIKILSPFHIGHLIVFYGPDGSGKSTTTKLIHTSLTNSAIRSRVQYFGWRNSFLPYIDLLMKTDNKIIKKNLYTRDPRKTSKPVLAIRSILISFLYYTEMYIRYCLKVMPYRKAGYIVLTDRYFFDRICLDKYLPRIIKQFLLFFTPKPSLCFYITTNPPLLSKRETCLPLENLILQKSSYDKYYRILKAHKIDTGKQDLEKIKHIIFTKIWEKTKII